MTSKKMTVCRLQIEDDMGKFYLKKTLGKIALLLIPILLLTFLSVPLSIMIGEKYGTDSPQIGVFYCSMFSLLIILIIGYVIWLNTSGFEEKCLQYIFVITSSSQLWVINCFDPIIQAIFKSPRSDIMANLGFYGIIFSLSRRTQYILDLAWKLSYVGDFDVIGYFSDSLNQGAHQVIWGQRISKVSNLKVHKNYITFNTVEKSNGFKEKKLRYKISRKFTNSDELIGVLKKLNK